MLAAQSGRPWLSTSSFVFIRALSDIIHFALPRYAGSTECSSCTIDVYFQVVTWVSAVGAVKPIVGRRHDAERHRDAGAHGEMRVRDAADPLAQEAAEDLAERHRGILEELDGHQDLLGAVLVGVQDELREGDVLVGDLGVLVQDDADVAVSLTVGIGSAAPELVRITVAARRIPPKSRSAISSARIVSSGTV